MHQGAHRLQIKVFINKISMNRRMAALINKEKIPMFQKEITVMADKSGKRREAKIQ